MLYYYHILLPLWRQGMDKQRRCLVPTVTEREVHFRKGAARALDESGARVAYDSSCGYVLFILRIIPVLL